MKVSIKKDSHGYIAEIEGIENVFAHGNTQDEARKNLLGVVEMMLEYHQELVQKDKKIREKILEAA